MGAQPSRPEPAFYIFLDVDGVLNSQQSRAYGDHLPTAASLELVARVVAAAAAAGLGQGRIVLSTTWRLRPDSLSRVQHALGSVGLQVHACTPDLEGAGRCTWRPPASSRHT